MTDKQTCIAFTLVQEVFNTLVKDERLDYVIKIIEEGHAVKISITVDIDDDAVHQLQERFRKIDAASEG